MASHFFCPIGSNCRRRTEFFLLRTTVHEKRGVNAPNGLRSIGGQQRRLLSSFSSPLAMAEADGNERASLFARAFFIRRPIFKTVASCFFGNREEERNVNLVCVRDLVGMRHATPHGRRSTNLFPPSHLPFASFLCTHYGGAANPNPASLRYCIYSTVYGSRAPV